MRKVILLFFVFLLFTKLSVAQINFYGFAATTSTYTPITGGTVHGTGAALDDETYSVTLPFSFNFNGTAYTNIFVSANGYVSFGATDPGTTTRTAISSTNAGFEVAGAFARDLGGTGASTELRTEVIGTGTNQIFVAQFTAFGNYSGTQNYNFQIRLNQANDVANNQTVQFVYGTFSSLTSTTAQVGLRGTTNATYNNRTTTTDWASTTTGTANTATCAISATVFPASGTTFTFTPPNNCSGTPLGGITTSNTTLACPGIAISLNVTGATSGAIGLTYQWQDSTGGGVFNDITGETNESLNITPTTTTSYRRRIFCNGSDNSFSTPIKVSLTNPTYAALPFSESFENTWIDACGGTRVVPNNSWRNNPLTTDSSWRRNDDVSNGWTSTAGGYTPAASQGTFSARFHSYQSSRIGLFDLHLDCSAGSSDKRLTFDYINTSGSDFLQIALSTDGGATFSPVDFAKDTIRIRSTWSQKVWEFNSSSPNTIIRFLAKGDAGFTDIGLDNVSVITLTNCVGTPSGGVTVSNTVVACANAIFGLSVTGSNTDPAGITTQWQDSIAGATWIDIPGATSLTLTTSQIEAKGYRRKISCTFSGLDSFSRPVWVAMSTPTYATLPFMESFENTWVDACGGTRVVPNNSWRNTPITSDSSWRRNDDASNGWTNTFGAYTPAASQGTFSARFHSYQSSKIGLFDLHIDCSAGSSDKRLTFDYINTSGSDFLQIALSTDGGATFSPVDFAKDTIRIRSAWSQKVWEFSSSSPNTIIRFLAKGDLGSTDIGLDNVSVVTLTNCVGTPSGGVTVSNTVVACANSIFALSVTGSNTEPAGITTQWQDSIAGAAWIDIPGATSLTLTTSQIESKGYRRKISCSFSGLDSFSRPIWVAISPATYAALPFMESFENTWVDACGGTKVIPNNSWRNNPLTSDSSWRRNDISTANNPANWRNPDSYAYSPGASQGTFSARFHSGFVESGRRGFFDLHLNCSSGSANKRLTFDYINTSGTDYLRVSVSTDGGATFSPVDFTKDTIRVRTAWTQKIWEFNSTTANTILRFTAVADYGSTDIGLDNIAVVSIPANDAAATSFVAPVGSLQVTNSGTITLKITNAGTAPIDFATNNAVVGVRVTNPSGVSTNYTTTLNAGVIASTSTQDVVITTAANFGSLGTYTLKGGITLTGDGNSLNDSTASVAVVSTPLAKNAIASGNWGDGATWTGGTIPTSTDSVNIVGFNVILEGAAAAPYNAYSINIGAAGTLTGGSKALEVGATGGGRNAFNIASTGTLIVNAGTNITHNGFILFNSGSNFTMSGGSLTIDGNNGTDVGSVQSSNDIFGIGTSTTSYSTGTVNVTGGTITIVDPHRFSSSSGTVVYRGASGVNINFGAGNNLILGNGTSTQISNGTSGFNLNTWVNSGRLSFGSLTINGGNSGVRFVTSSYGFGINGNLTINAGSEARFTSQPYIAGNLVNNGLYATSTTLQFSNYLNGTATASTTAQTISGAGLFRNTLPSMTVSASGTGYAVGNVLTVVGGTAATPATVFVTGVNGTGGITSFVMHNMGDYSVAPATSPVSVTGGSGTGATFSVTTLSNFVTTACFTNLIVNNTHTDGLTINSLSRMSNATGHISGTLTLTNGVINNNVPIILGTSVSSRGTLAYTNGFIRGKFGRWFGAATNTGNTGDFPVGKDTIQMARVEFTTAPNKGGVLTAEFINTNPGFTGLPLNDAGQNLDKVATEGYWRIDNDTITGGVYTLSLTGRKFANVQTLATLRSVKRPTNGTTWTLNGTSGTNTGTLAIPVVVRTGMSGFSEFAIAGGTDNILPYTKLSFSGVKTANGNKLNWIVTNEFNSKGYQLERSIDGVNFAEINYVSSKNVLSTPSNTEYSFTDFAPFKGNTYYRLKQLDNDGKFSYSNIVLMRGLKTTTLSISGVYPNPASNLLNLLVASPNDKLLSIRVMDINGKVVVQNSRNVVSGDNVLQLNIKALAKGTYSVQAICNEGCETKSQIFVKQ